MQYDRFRRTPAWPYLVVAMGLFTIVLVAVRMWRAPAAQDEVARSVLVSQATQTQGEDWPVLSAVDGSIDLDATIEIPVVTVRRPTPEPLETVALESPQLDAVAPMLPDQSSVPELLTAEPAMPAADPSVDVSAAPIEPSAPTLAVSSPDAVATDQESVVPGPDVVSGSESSVESISPKAHISVSDEPLATPAIVPEVPQTPPGIWPNLKGLLALLDPLQGDREVERWSATVRQSVDQLALLTALDDPQVVEILRRLSSDSKRGLKLAEKVPTIELRADLLRAVHGLSRRNMVWQRLVDVVDQPQFISANLPVDSESMSECLKAVTLRLDESEGARAWRDYLLVDQVRQSLDSSAGGDELQRRDLAARVISRLNSPKLSFEQRHLLSEHPFLQYRDELQLWCLDPVNYLDLLGAIESYEASSCSRDAAILMNAYHSMRRMPDAQAQNFGRELDANYRNGNVRVAMSEELLNRLLPDPNVMVENVRESILGARVWGTSRTFSRLRIVLVPDRWNWRMDLEAQGQVESQTAARKGPATLFNQGVSSFRARKPLMVDRRGIMVAGAEAGVNSDNDLTGVETEFDGIPILGQLARNLVLRQHASLYQQAKTEADQRVADRAREMFDAEVHRRLMEFEQQFDKQLLEPLRRMDLKPTPVAMETTAERLIVRYRLASDRQLAAYTPRPQAPSDSLLSVQIHESAVNNMFDQLQLQDRPMDLRELYREVSDRFNRLDATIPDDVPEGVIVRLASQDPIRIRCADGRVTLTLRVADLRADQHHWRDFGVRVHYVPDQSQTQANLVRDGVVELNGERLSSRNRLPLRAIFTKVFARTRNINIISSKLAEDPRLSDLRVNQFVVADGWLGVAIGPPRIAHVPLAPPSVPHSTLANPLRRGFLRR